MRSNVQRVLARQRNIDLNARDRPLREWGNPGLAAADKLAEGVREGRRQEGIGMFLLARKPGNASLAMLWTG
jgi:hypothetical protein